MKKNIPLIIFSLVDLILVFVLVILVNRLNILPFKYLIFIILIILLISVIATLFQKLNKKVFKVISYIIFSIILIVSSIGIYYSVVTLSFINKSFNTIKNTYTNTFIVVTSKYDDIYDLINRKVGYYKSIPNIDKTIDKLKSMLEFEDIAYSNITSLLEDLKSNKIDGLVVEEEIYKSLSGNIKNIPFDKYKSIYSIEITVDEEISKNDTGDVFNLYISGNDFTNSNSDFNMIITVNRKSKKILLTSIPRDYNFYMPSLGVNDSLEFASAWGVNVPKEGLEKLLDINIDYYLKIKTQSLVDLVDTLNGVKFCSDRSFYTTHATILDSYDDTEGEKLYVKNGCHEYSGVEILTIARERLAYRDGDRQRQKNCQQIMINIFNKMLNFDTVFNYVNILDKLSDLYVTNMPDKLITGIIKDIIDGNNYDIETQSLDGYANAGYIRAGSIYGYVMTPYTESVENGSAKIKEVSK